MPAAALGADPGFTDAVAALRAALGNLARGLGALAERSE
jgi:hypothetical protein